MELSDLKLNHVYSAKHPRVVGLYGEWNDRMIVWIGLTVVQYDSPSVSNGRHYPTIDKDKFITWAKEDITDQMEKGKWRTR